MKYLETKAYSEHYQTSMMEHFPKKKKLPGAFLGPSSKNKKIHCEKKFLIFQEKEFSSSNIKKFLILSYISGNGTFQLKLKK